VSTRHAARQCMLHVTVCQHAHEVLRRERLAAHGPTVRVQSAYKQREPQQSKADTPVRCNHLDSRCAFSIVVWCCSGLFSKFLDGLPFELVPLHRSLVFCLNAPRKNDDGGNSSKSGRRVRDERAPSELDLDLHCALGELQNVRAHSQEMHAHATQLGITDGHICNSVQESDQAHETHAKYQAPCCLYACVREPMLSSRWPDIHMGAQTVKHAGTQARWHARRHACRQVQVCGW
jgi:hypothetical protein